MNTQHDENTTNAECHTERLELLDSDLESGERLVELLASLLDLGLHAVPLGVDQVFALLDHAVDALEPVPAVAVGLDHVQTNLVGHLVQEQELLPRTHAVLVQIDWETERRIV